MTVDQLIAHAEQIKGSGYSSKIPVPINVFLEIARDAKAWQSAPQIVKDAATAARAE